MGAASFQDEEDEVPGTPQMPPSPQDPPKAVGTLEKEEVEGSVSGISSKSSSSKAADPSIGGGEGDRRLADVDEGAVSKSSPSKSGPPTFGRPIGLSPVFDMSVDIFRPCPTPIAPASPASALPCAGCEPRFNAARDEAADSAAAGLLGCRGGPIGATPFTCCAFVEGDVLVTGAPALEEGECIKGEAGMPLGVFESTGG